MKPIVYKLGKYWFIKYLSDQGYMEYIACINWEVAIENAIAHATTTKETANEQFDQPRHGTATTRHS